MKTKKGGIVEKLSKTYDYNPDHDKPLPSEWTKVVTDSNCYRIASSVPNQSSKKEKI